VSVINPQRLHLEKFAQGGEDLYNAVVEQKVGFIGLGLMGNPMAKNILKKGFSLTVYNRTKEKTVDLVSLGALVADSPAVLAKEVDVIITMVTSGKDVAEVLFGKNGVAQGAKKGLIVIDMSTIGPTTAKDISQKLHKHGIAFLDAPVTGSTPKAISGELTIFVGGEKEILDSVYGVLSAMGTNIVYLGQAGSGQAIKLINNSPYAKTKQHVM
jgi:3-hydroxyisobutyrate dehydrogenase-like beta-hydroxyacid dehydrogenase